MNARERILEKIRSATTNNTSQGFGTATKAVPAKSLPMDSQLLGEAFITRARANGSAAKYVASIDHLESILTSFAPQLTIPDQTLYRGFNEVCTIDDEAGVVLVKADAAIAETGSVCIHNGQIPSPTLFLCDHLIVLIDTSSLLAYLEDYWQKTDPHIASAIHIISGPSRTADVEQSIHIGAHGPREVSCLLLQTA